MYLNSEKKSSLTVGDDERITRCGRFLRKYKLDELPQLMNVLRGDMSIVGPRPEVLDFVNRYPLESRNIILSIRPGITDEASIAMINENEVLKNYDNPQEAYIDNIIPFKIDHYLEYVENRSFFRDCKIIIKTLLKIFF
jgi:lipopolysaccharide/colanic/teichoic acid biosynthesis glycosyltransferase